jgi:hypothetical protein
MKTFKRFLRLLALILVIAMASVLPVPITFFRKDDLPKNLIEQIDTNKDEDEKDNIKEMF